MIASHRNPVNGQLAARYRWLLLALLLFFAFGCKAVDTLSTTAKSNHQDESIAAYNQGMEYDSEGRYDKAIEA